MKSSPGFLLLRILTFILASSHQAATPQTTGINPQSFEVATVRQTPPGERGDSIWSPPGTGRFTASRVTLVFLIQMAYGIDPNQVYGKPDWIESDQYDLVAKAEDGVALSRDELKPRLQNLLSQRFHLRLHHETKFVKGYAMVVAKSGSRLTKSKGDHPPGYRIYVGPSRVEGLNWSMQYLAAMLQHPTGLPVVDETGISGNYDVRLEFAPDLESASDLPTIFTELHDTLGLELKPERVPIDVVVIDHVDRAPTEN